MGIARVGQRSALLAALLLTAALGGCATTQDSEAPASSDAHSSTSNSPLPDTELQISIYADGSKLSDQYLLQCQGPRDLDTSTLPTAEAACQLLADQPEVLVSQRPPGQMCTEIYGGPDRATVSGTLQGQAIHREFSRSNGCAIDQWDALSVLLGNPGL